MKYRYLTGTRLRVSILSYGVYSLTGMYGEVDIDHGLGLLKIAQKLGINFFDTADIYGRGLGEEILRRAFGKDIERVIVATKIGYDFYNHEKPKRRYDREYLEYALQMSLERLGRSNIDLIYIHNPPLNILRGRIIWEVLRDFRECGYIRYTGIALGPEVNVLEHAKEAVKYEETMAIQFVYNMLEQYPGREISRMARDAGIGIIVRVPHGGGVLDESIRPGMERGLRDHRSLRRGGWYEWAYKVYDMMNGVMDAIDGTPGQKALKFIEESIDPDSIILISNDIQRLNEYIGYIDIQDLPRNILDELIEIHDRYMHLNPEINR